MANRERSMPLCWIMEEIGNPDPTNDKLANLRQEIKSCGCRISITAPYTARVYRCNYPGAAEDDHYLFCDPVTKHFASLGLTRRS